MHYKTGDKIVAICENPVKSDEYTYPPKGTIGTVVSVDDDATRLDICVDWVGYDYVWVSSDEVKLVEPKREYLNETYSEWVERMYNEFRKNDNIKLDSYLSDGKFILIDFNAERVEFGMCDQSGIIPEDFAKTYAKLMGYEIRNPHEKIKDLKPGDTFELISGTPYKLIKFDKIEGAEMAVVKSLETNKYYLHGIETYIYNVKEN